MGDAHAAVAHPDGVQNALADFLAHRVRMDLHACGHLVHGVAAQGIVYGLQPRNIVVVALKVAFGQAQRQLQRLQHLGISGSGAGEERYQFLNTLLAQSREIWNCALFLSQPDHTLSLPISATFSGEPWTKPTCFGGLANFQMVRVIGPSYVPGLLISPNLPKGMWPCRIGQG